MKADDYDRIRTAFDELGQVAPSSLRTIDEENVRVARRQLAWSLRRWGVEFEGGIPDVAARLAPDGIDGESGERLRSAADELEDARERMGFGDLDVSDEQHAEVVEEIEETIADLESAIRELALVVEVQEETDDEHSA